MGYILMRLREDGDGSPWPGINNDDRLLARIANRIEYRKAPVFESTDAFFKANESRRRKRA